MIELDVRKIIEIFQLQPHPRENGYFRETYRSEERLTSDLPARYQTARCFSTAILFLLESGKFSAWHRLQSEEVFHYYLGGPAELLVIDSEGVLTTATLGPDFNAGQVVQAVVPRGAWQALRLQPDAPGVLVGCTVAPGFEYSDYEDGEKDVLLRSYPEHSELISRLVKS